MGRKLAGVFSSAAFQSYYKDAYNRPPERHITLGPMLTLIKKFKRHKPELQQVIIDANIHLQDDEALISKLYAAMKYRNDGAHRDGLSEAEFLELRNLLFRDGVLKRFVELL